MIRDCKKPNEEEFISKGITMDLENIDDIEELNELSEMEIEENEDGNFFESETYVILPLFSKM